MQTRPWTSPPTTLPKAFVETTRFLLAHGMGDPRGGEFREATLAHAYDLHGKPRVVRGWVLRGERPSIVTTSGLVYDVAEIGSPLDVAKDVQTQKDARRMPDGGWYTNGDWDVLYATVLLVAGRTDLAEGLFGTVPRRGPLTGFLGAWLTQAIEAHEKGDDALALRAASGVAARRGSFENEASQGGLPSGWEDRLDFAHIAPDLAADAARPRPQLDLNELQKKPPSERVTELIDRLDDVTGTGKVDGETTLGNDPLITALVAIGDSAVLRLIETIEQDARLTRAVDKRPTILLIYRPVTVREAAYVALQGILQVRELPKMTDLPALRAFWEANRSLAPTERWLRILQDDQAGLYAWQEAARSLFGDGVWTPRPNPLPAEALRGSNEASLREVLVRRATRLADKAQEDRTGFGKEMDLALTFAADLALWTPGESLPTLQAATDRAMSPDVPLEWLRSPFAEAMRARGDREGADAWKAYAAWVERIRTAPLELSDTEAFRPLLERRNVPELQTAMRAVLASPDSSWSIGQRARSIRAFSWLQAYLLSPLLDDVVFREAVETALDDRTHVGTVTVEASDMVIFNDDLNGSRMGGYGRGDDVSVLTDPLRPAFEEKIPVRACDQVATALARLKGAPAYRPYWPEAKRDEAIAAFKTFLRSHAGKLESLLPEPDFTGRR